MGQSDNSLGQFLRRLRCKAKITLEEAQHGFTRVTQELLAARMGWTSAAHISEIETGKRIPDAATIQRWIAACAASHADLYRALGMSGGMPKPLIPNSKAIIPLLENVIARDLHQRGYPAYIVDYRNTVWAANGPTAIFFESYTTMCQQVERSLNLFNPVFDSRVPFYQQVQQREQFQIGQILQYRAVNVRNQHAPFYLSFPERLAAQLLPEDGDAFLTMWAAVHAMDELPEMVIHTVEFGYMLADQYPATFTIYDDYIKNFDHMFACIYMDLNRAQTPDPRQVDALFAPLCDLPVVRLWDLIDVDALLERYRTGEW